MTRLNRTWKKSSRSGTGNCVEARLTEAGDVQVRDSKNPCGPVLAFAPTEWEAFITGVKAEEFTL